MFFEDARDLTTTAVQLLKSQKHDLGCPGLEIWSLPDFSKFVLSQGLTHNEKATIVEQAILLIDQFYAHLPFKRARYAVDPVQSLRLIRAQVGELTDLAFHERMIVALTGLRDAHTFYALPKPYKGAMVFLPFQLRCFRDPKGKDDKEGKRRFIVTKLLEGFDHPHFKVEAEILSWNGVPIEQAIEREGHQDPGGNRSSRFARGINRICDRSLTLSVPPQENFVVLEYVAGKGGAERFGIVLPWYIATDCINYKHRQGSNSSVNESMADMAQVRSIFFRRTEGTPAKNTFSYTAAGGWGAGGQQTEDHANADLNQISRYPHVFSFQHSGGVAQPDGVDPAVLHDPAHPQQKFNYIRIRTFDLDPSDPKASDKFVEEFRRIAALMQELAPDGMILDVRSNPGGSIDAAERILQCLTPAQIQPADFHFIVSGMTEKIASILFHTKVTDVQTANQREWMPWADDLVNSIADGGIITAGRPLTQPEQANDAGQIYQGPVTLIIDALAYSATDIFAAGFQDHHIGSIIGVDENTGGGGANRWLHEELMRNMTLHGLHELPLEKLPCEAQLGLAIRRSSRVARNAGNVLEDLGVKADVLHHNTRRDLLHNSADLLAFACGQLGPTPAYLLKIKSAEVRGDVIAVSVLTRGLFRIECLVNGLSQCSFPAGGPDETLLDFLVPASGLLDPPESLSLNGFAKIEDEIRGAVLQFVVTAGQGFDQATTPAPQTSAAGGTTA